MMHLDCQEPEHKYMASYTVAGSLFSGSRGQKSLPLQRGKPSILDIRCRKLSDEFRTVSYFITSEPFSSSGLRSPPKIHS
jgi:hypothetical protein